MVMKNNINDTRIDQNELKIILDEIERGCFDNQEQVFNEIYDRVIKPHLQKHGDFERQEQQRLDEAQREFDEHRTDLEMVPYREWLKGYIKAKKEILG